MRESAHDDSSTWTGTVGIQKSWFLLLSRSCVDGETVSRPSWLGVCSCNAFSISCIRLSRFETYLNSHSAFRRGEQKPEARHSLRIHQPHIAIRLNKDTVNLVATTTLAGMLSIALDFLATACLTSPPNPLTLVHGPIECAREIRNGRKMAKSPPFMGNIIRGL